MIVVYVVVLIWWLRTIFFFFYYPTTCSVTWFPNIVGGEIIMPVICLHRKAVLYNDGLTISSDRRRTGRRFVFRRTVTVAGSYRRPSRLTVTVDGLELG